ncbi:MAG: nucleoside deaminase [Bacteroidota bacterium]
MTDNEFIELCIEMAITNVASRFGGPFAAIIVKDDKIVGKGTNLVTKLNDPTAHAEVMAIRDACSNLKTFQLRGCQIYCSCEPCPMCFGAIFWARLDKVFFAAQKGHASYAGFDDSFIYEQIDVSPGSRSIPFKQILSHRLNEPFEMWKEKNDRIEY